MTASHLAHLALPSPEGFTTTHHALRDANGNTNKEKSIIDLFVESSDGRASLMPSAQNATAPEGELIKAEDDVVDMNSKMVIPDSL